MLLVLFASASAAIAKPSREVVAVNQLMFNQDDAGNYTAFSREHPAPLHEFENPILCEEVVYLNRNIPNGRVPFCLYPTVFFAHGGRIIKPKGDPSYMPMFHKSVLNQATGIYNEFYLLDTPESVYWCNYWDNSIANCELFPSDPDVKVGDQFFACMASYIDWYVDKNGKVLDCDPPGPMHIARVGKLIVDSISPDGVASLHFIVNYIGSDGKHTQPLENGRLPMMLYSGGSDPDYTYIVVKVQPETKTKPKVSKSKPKTKKK